MEPPDFQLVPEPRREAPAKADAGASPFKIVIDPKMRAQLRRALIELIDYHDEALADHYADGKLALESYKEYIELFARSLKETMESREGVSYLLRSVGFDVPPEEVNLHPELRWKAPPSPDESGAERPPAPEARRITHPFLPRIATRSGHNSRLSPRVSSEKNRLHHDHVYRLVNRG